MTPRHHLPDACGSGASHVQTGVAVRGEALTLVPTTRDGVPR